MRKISFRVAVLILLVAIPAALWQLWIDFPERVVLPRGPENGRHELITRDLREELLHRLEIRAEQSVESHGSFANLRSLQRGEVDLALYQSGTSGPEFTARDTDRDGRLDPSEHATGDPAIDRADFRILDADGDGLLSADEFRGTHRVSFIANLYSEVAHVLARTDSEVHDLALLRRGPSSKGPIPRVAIGHPGSGDLAFSRLLVDHLGWRVGVDYEPRSLTYPELVRAFHDGSVDVAFITAGLNAPVIRTLLESGACRLLSVPDAKALATRELLVATYTIPTGLYLGSRDSIPRREVETVALRACLLARSDLHEGLVERLTALVLADPFIKRNDLRELFALDAAARSRFAQERPEFPIHAGAWSHYDPDPHPLLPTDFVEATEGMRSFIVSVLIAVWLAVRWLRQYRVERQEHRLDRYIRSLLDIERRQMALDERGDGSDEHGLQHLLDDVTRLREEALGEFSAHEINRDPAVDCFVHMCHELSQKINAKLTRQRLDRGFARLGELLEERAAGGPPPTGPAE